MTFTTPLALLFLLALPYFVWLGRPRTNRPRDWVSLGLRLLIIALLVLSLAGSQVVRAADDLAVVFLIDASDSVGSEQAAQAEAFVREAIERMGPNDQAAVVVFGANALVERPMSGLAELAPISSVPQTFHTDMAEAIRLGLALFPAGSARRMVLLTDGIPTLGDAREAARLATTAGVQIDIVPLPRETGNVEAWLSGVEAPSRVVQGESFRINVTAESTAAMPATLRLLSGGSVVYEEAVQLRAGVNNFPIRLRAAEQEFARYVVQLEPTVDTFYQNNQLAAFTEIVGPPRILLVAYDGTTNEDGLDPADEFAPVEAPLSDDAPQLQLALEGVGLTVDRVTPAQLPADLGGLSNYATVVLVNVNAKHLSSRKMETLQSYVRDLGGGLVAIGGPNSYGMGGYFRTPLEEALPVDMQITDQDRFPSVSIVIVVDRSGSMGVREGSLTKIQLAAEAAVRVVELLNDFDEITVIPVDTRPSNPVGPMPASEREQAIGLIRQMTAGGGGIYVRTGLEAAAEALAASNTQVKHIIVLADGSDAEEKEGVPELLAALTAEGITISMVSIGAGPDVPWLQQMAELGNGRFHFTDRAANLPQIFTQETTSIQRSYLIEERFFPTLASNSPIVAGIQSVPPLYGYVGASPKGTAQVILTTHQDDPLLAVWQYGLGRSLAWTSDATGRWAVDWVQWQGFPIFWAQAVRWTVSQNRDSNVETAVTYTGREARLTVDARDGTGLFLNSLNLEANVVSPDGRTTHLNLRQVAPGRYVADFAPGREGAYFIRVAGAADSDEADEAVVGQTSGWVLGYSPEYRHVETNPQLLAQIAELTGGRDVTGDSAAVFIHNLAGDRVSRPIWPWLTMLAVLLLPVDVALRRIVVTRQDARRAWAATFGRLQPDVTTVAERPAQVARLFQAKQRAGKSGSGEGPTGQDRGAADSTGMELPPPILRQDATQTAVGEKSDAAEQRPLAAPRPPTPATKSGSPLASRLLEKKRQQQDAARKDDET